MELKKLLVNGIEYEFVCVSSGTRTGFKHSVSLFSKNQLINEGVCHYINRTWERFSFQTAMLTAVRNELDYIKTRLLYRIKTDNSYTKMTDKRNQEFEKVLQNDSSFIELHALYDVISDYDKYYSAINYEGSK